MYTSLVGATFAFADSARCFAFDLGCSAGSVAGGARISRLPFLAPSLSECLAFILNSLPELANQLQAQLALSLLRQLQQGDG